MSNSNKKFNYIWHNNPKNPIALRKFVPIIFASCILLSSCGSPKYISEVPYKFKFDEKAIKHQLGISDAKVVKANEYDENLTDREILLKEKYAIILNVTPKEIDNYSFYGFIDEWLNTPYSSEKSMSKKGLNMVPFTQALYNQVYKVKLPAASAAEIFTSPLIEKFTGRAFLEEGDLIFFRYNKDLPVSDVAIYLKNDKILMSTRGSGLAIFDFNDSYFQTRYLAAGRIQQKEESGDN